MTTLAEAPAISIPSRSKLSWAVRDGLAVTWRNLLHYVRVPQLIFFSSIQPILFVLLFRYVFGGAIQVPGLDYVNYMMPGIFAQTVVFGAAATGVGLAEDIHRGVVNRFRALPMARSAVLVGRTTADSVRNLLVVIVMFTVGVLVGFRPSTGVLGVIAGIALMLFFAYALAWGMALIGLNAPNSETAQVMIFPLLMPLTFASSAFVPVDSMPSWLQVFTRNQPVSKVIDAVRALMLGGPTARPVLQALVWIVGLLAVLAPLAVMRYRKAT
jgi:ABC-2 type transport system permease protein/oleandomycin transport system permease protein